MPNLVLTGARRRLPLALILLAAAPPVLAQAYPAGAVVEHVSRPGDPAELLAGALRTLAASPNDVDALVTAGENALALGDPNAAVGFFGRASGLAPRNGKVKAGLGSALVQLERPADALRLFADARRLGVADVDLAEDRGLAYDLTGDQRRAQADYQLVLAAHPDDDVARRRLALSQGISGDRAAAIATLDPLIRKRDIAGWRAQTFVLAMTGDPQGANAITRVMLPSQADMLQPFLVRLDRLSAADKARAVHFGEMPEGGRNYTPGQLANLGAAPTYQPLPSQQVRAPVTAQRSDLAPAPAVVTPPPPAVAPVQTAASTLPLPVAAASGHYDLPHAAVARAPAAPVRVAPRPIAPSPAPALALVPAEQPATSRRTPSAPRTVGTPVVHRTAHTEALAPRYATELADIEPAVSTRHHATDADADETVRVTSRGHHGQADAADESSDKAATSHHARSRRAADEVASADEATAGRRGKVSTHADEEGDDTGTSSRKHGRSHAAAADDEADGGPPKKARHGKPATADDETNDDASQKGRRARHAAADDETDDGASKGKHAKAEKAAPSRVYVQVAGGANKDDLDKAWAGVKKKAPALAKGHTPLTTPLRHTNRLLVGPFKDDDAAQAYVNKMAGKGVSAFIFKSDKGQKVGAIDSGQ